MSKHIFLLFYTKHQLQKDNYKNDQHLKKKDILIINSKLKSGHFIKQLKNNYFISTWKTC